MCPGDERARAVKRPWWRLGRRNEPPNDHSDDVIRARQIRSDRSRHRTSQIQVAPGSEGLVRRGSSRLSHPGARCRLIQASDQGEGSTKGEMMVQVVMFSAFFLAAAIVPAAAETRDDGGRLGIGQGANSCWAWTRSHEAKAATQGLYTQWVAGFVSGVSWETDDPDILTGMDFDGLMAWVHDYCKANPLAKVTTGAAMLVQELRARAQRK